MIVDDHPMIIDHYSNLLTKTGFIKNKINIKSYNYQDVYSNLFLNLKFQKNINLALLDAALTPNKGFDFNNFLDFALFIRTKFTECKIIISIMHTDSLVIDKIIKKIKPEGFFSKSDVCSKSFSSICGEIIDGNVYYSQRIVESQKELFKKNINWDSHDNEILLLISQGIKTINLPKYIPLSMSAIEKRKANIKDQLLKGKGTDKDLIFHARKIGLL
ncbi:response regulator [Flavobacterium sp. HJSW_4]|uniref:response regulator n=1 Tax=Flavobacterium sp. HJSW_4 TaxID=3344660 RepID=UPI0036D2C6D4